MIKIKKRKLIFSSVITLIFALTFAYLGYKVSHSSKSQNDPWIVADVSKYSGRFISKETLIKDIKDKQALITMETELEETITLNDSWGQFEIFKKLQTIHFYGRGIYSIDLSSLTSDSIKEDMKNNSITIMVPEPIIKDIILDENKTLYESPEMGILRIGDITLSPAEYDVILSHIKTRMKEKLSETENIDNAREKSSSSLKSIVSTLCNVDQSKISIEFQ